MVCVLSEMQKALGDAGAVFWSPVSFVFNSKTQTGDISQLKGNYKINDNFESCYRRWWPIGIACGLRHKKGLSLSHYRERGYRNSFYTRPH